MADQDMWSADGETLSDGNWGVTCSDFHFSFHSDFHLVGVITFDTRAMYDE